jgi:hypothetical protein
MGYVSYRKKEQRTQIVCLIIFLIGMACMAITMAYQPEPTYVASTNCRMQSCNRPAAYSDWGRQFCSEHLDGDKKCHFGECNNMLPRRSKEIYCDECIAYAASKH